MALTKYHRKRKFGSTPEPKGGKPSTGSPQESPSKDSLHFVVQKHAASRLHYDFRLEMNGVLKSWAVPKGPSLNPKDKRLAMMVEDHPYDYRKFEGVIPKGNYGAGTVIVWDEGIYAPLGASGEKKKDEKALLQQLKEGSLKFSLHGSKLKGEFALVKMKNAENNAWLLIKHRDQYASAADIAKKDKSVISKKTLDQTAKNPKQLYKQAEAAMDISDAPEAPFPKTIAPMLATLVDRPVEQKGWEYEIKWDGYRAIALCNKKTVSLISRNNKSYNEKFYPIYQALKKWSVRAVVDGELCVLNKQGIARFGSLQNWRSETDGNLVYYVFDLLYLNGRDLTQLPLSRRRQLLRDILPQDDLIRYSESFDTSAASFLEAAAKLGMEGIVAKRSDSVYNQDSRSRDWLKIKTHKRHEVVIGGYTKNEGSPKLFSSLLVGVYQEGRLCYTGKIGTGFNESLQKQMMKAFQPLIRKRNPFTAQPDINKPSRFRPNPPHAKAVWLKPELVCEVSYTETTDDGLMRHPSFVGMRKDKEAKKVVAETAAATKELLEEKENKKAKKMLKPPAPRKRVTLLNPSEERQVKKLNGHELQFTNLSKIYWPDDKVTKRDMLNYYYEAAPYILPYLIDRPQSLNRYPNGIKGKSFYQKDVTGKAPEWIKQYPYRTNEGEDKNFMVPENEAGLLYMANLGAIEMNPWNSVIQKPEHPTWCLLDIDPDKKNSFEQVIQTALTIREVLEEMHIEGYVKTSGSTGIHIYIPLGAKYSYDECQLFARLTAIRAQERLPGFTSIERLVKNRKGKIYIDYLQNRPKATLAAPYSLRPKPGATVSMPLHWDEVKPGLKMTDFNIKNALQRIRSEGDIFKPVLSRGINLLKALKELE